MLFFCVKTCVLPSQGPTAPDACYDLLKEFMEAWDLNAVEEKDDAVVPIRGPLTGVNLVERFSLGTSHLSPILRLPYSDMEEVLKRIVNQDAIWHFARKNHGGDPATFMLSAKTFFKSMDEYIKLYLQQKTLDFWLWVRDYNLSQLGVSLEALKVELTKTGQVSKWNGRR